MVARPGYDPGRIARIVEALADSAREATELSEAIGRDLDEAAAILSATAAFTGGGAHGGTGAAGGAPDGGDGAGDGAGEARPAWSTPGDSCRRGLTLLASSAPAEAAEVQRRLDHLRGCELLHREGFAVNAGTVFDDAPVPTPDQVRQDVRRFRDVIGPDHGWDGNQDDLQRINDLIGEMGAAERQAFVGALTDQDLDDWNREASRGGGWFSGHGLTAEQSRRLADTLLPDLDRAQRERLLARLRAAFPS